MDPAKELTRSCDVRTRSRHAQALPAHKACFLLHLPEPLKATQAPTGVLQLPMLQVTLRLPAKPGLQLTMHMLPLAVPGQY
jgi:hypothetical protein